MKLYENQIPPWVFSNQFSKHFWNSLYLEHPQALAYALVLIKWLFSKKSMYSIVFSQTFCNTPISFCSFIKNVFLHRCLLWNFLNFAKFLENFGQVQCIVFPGCEVKDTVGFNFVSLSKTTWILFACFSFSFLFSICFYCWSNCQCWEYHRYGM